MTATIAVYSPCAESRGRIIKDVIRVCSVRSTNVARRVQAGGLPEISRGSSEATPPVNVALTNPHPGRGARQLRARSGTPVGVRAASYVVRWCRRFAAQPPANLWQASGL